MVQSYKRYKVITHAYEVIIYRLIFTSVSEVIIYLPILTRLSNETHTSANEVIIFAVSLPQGYNSYFFKIMFRSLLSVIIDQNLLYLFILKVQSVLV